MRSLFIASIGNPPPNYHKTLHSAGHILLRALAEHLCADGFAPSPLLKSGLTANAYLPRSQARLTLWQSPTLMNVTGPTLVGAYKTWLAGEGVSSVLKKISPPTPPSSTDTDAKPPPKKKQKKSPTDTHSPLRLIIIHDELDLPPGQLRLRRGGAELSARGHNGLRSITQSLVKANLLPAPNSPAAKDADAPVLIRVGIGIGRPASREPGVVADYVLRQMREAQIRETGERAGMLAEMLEQEMGRWE